MLDKIDRKILYELDLNSRQPVKNIAKKLKLSREVVNYRLKKMIDSKIIRNFTTSISVFKVGSFIVKTYISFVDVSILKEKEIINYLLKNKKVGWIYKVMGKWDLNIIFFGEDLKDFSIFWNDFYSKFGKFIYDKETTIFEHGEIFPRDFLIENLNYEKKDFSRVFSILNENHSLDDTEKGILKILSNNSRENILFIAKKLNVSTNTIYSKIKKLEKSKVILGNTIGINHELLNLNYYKVLLYFKDYNESNFNKLKSFCKNNSKIWSLSKFVGGADLEFEIFVNNDDELNNVIYKIKEFKIIKRIEIIKYNKEYIYNFYPDSF
jgi:DNA-binding Lrp family transcriptional regulator